MSGPILHNHFGSTTISGVAGTYDGVTVTVRPDLGGLALLAPPVTGGQVAGGGLSVPSWMMDELHMRGDFQVSPTLGQPLGAVLQFSTPIRQVRTRLYYMHGTGMRLYAVENAARFGVGGAFTSLANVNWNPNETGERVLVSDTPFQFVVLQAPNLDLATQGVGIYCPTFEMNFYQELPVPAPATGTLDLALPRGSGRTLSYWWPPIEEIFDGNQPALRMQQRPQGAPNTPSIVDIPYGSPPGPQGGITWHGKRAIVLSAGATSGHWYGPTFNAGPVQIYFALERPTLANLAGLDEIACWRVAALLAFENPPGPVPNDYGIMIGPGSSIVPRGGQMGWSFGLRSTGLLGFTVRQTTSAPITYDKTYDLGAAFDVTTWHRYEVRMLSATLDTEAMVKVLVDGQVLDTVFFGPGHPFPPMQEGANLGYYWSVGNHGGAAFTTRMYLALGGLQIDAAATEDALL